MADTNTVDQGAIVNDFQNEFVSQEAELELQDPNNGQTMGDETPAPVETPIAKPQVQPQAKQAVAPNAQPKPAAQPIDELQKPFHDEAGNFSAEKWIEYFNSTKRKSPNPVSPKIEQSTTPQEIDNKAPWEKMYEEQRTYKTTLNGNLMAWKEQYLEAKKAGYDDFQAQNYADGKINEWLGDHLERRNAEQAYKMQQEGSSKQQEAMEMARLKPVADSNYTLVASEYGGSDKLHTLLTNKELGGDFTMWLFDRDNQGKKFSSQTELNDAIDTWFVKKLGQNPDDLRRLAEYGLARYRDKYFPKIVEQIKKNGASATAQRKAVVSPQTRTVNKPASIGKADALDTFMTPYDQREFVRQEA